MTVRGRPAQQLRGKGYVLAIGGHAKSPSVASSGIPEIRFELPPSPAAPVPPRGPFHERVKSYTTDPDELLPELVKDLEAVSDTWALGTSEQRVKQTNVAESSSVASTGSPTLAARPVMLSPLDILAVLKSTTVAIRSVRNYLVVLPEDHDDSPPPATTLLSPSLSPRNKPVPLPPQSGVTPLSLIRQLALELLGVLRGIEEKYRLPMTEEASDVLSDYGSVSNRSRVPSPGSDGSESGTSFAFSMVKPKGIEREILVYSDDEDDINKEELDEKRETWDEKLVLGGGWLYRQNVTLLDLEKEREVVAHYLEAVDKLIFGGETPLHQRGWAFALQRLLARRRRSANSEQLSPNPGDIQAGHVRGNRVVSNGLLDAMRAMVVNEENESEPPSPASHDFWDEGHLPDWAKATCFVDDLLGEYFTPRPTASLLKLFTGRASAVLHHLLPPELSQHLPPVDLPPDREALLLALSSGQLLCVAYNIGIRRSKKPWGYINKAAIHDIAALEAETLTKAAQENASGKKRTWTFRRTENLRLWAACVPIASTVIGDSPHNPQRSQTAIHAPTRLKFPAQRYILTNKHSSFFADSNHHCFPSIGPSNAVRRAHCRKARGTLGGHARTCTIQVG